MLLAIKGFPQGECGNFLLDGHRAMLDSNPINIWNEKSCPFRVTTSMYWVWLHLVTVTVSVIWICCEGRAESESCCARCLQANVHLQAWQYPHTHLNGSIIVNLNLMFTGQLTLLAVLHQLIGKENPMSDRGVGLVCAATGGKLSAELIVCALLVTSTCCSFFLPLVK